MEKKMKIVAEGPLISGGDYGIICPAWSSRDRGEAMRKPKTETMKEDVTLRRTTAVRGLADARRPPQDTGEIARNNEHDGRSGGGSLGPLSFCGKEARP